MLNVRIFVSIIYLHSVITRKMLIKITSAAKANVYDTNTEFCNLHWYKRPDISM